MEINLNSSTKGVESLSQTKNVESLYISNLVILPKNLCSQSTKTLKYCIVKNPK